MHTVSVLLNAQEAEQFKAWRSAQANFELLLKAGVFDMRNGSVEIHFNPQGDIALIELHAKVYRR